MECNPEQMVARIPGFEQGTQSVARSIHNAVIKTEPTRHLADVLHGVWLGHPLHPALTDFVIGAWLSGVLIDGITVTNKSKGLKLAADTLIAAGNAAAIPTALAGLTDFSTIPRKSSATAATHALLNAGGLVMNIISSACRCSGKRETGRTLSAVAAGTLLFSAWLGGKLTYQQKVGVNRIPDAEMKGEWRSALKESDLEENKPMHVDIDGVPVLICRQDGKTHAIGAVCAHEGGPLHKGRVHGKHVTCPWHQSVYDLEDGHVVHGPATYPEPVFEVRSTEGNLEIKAGQ